MDEHPSVAFGVLSTNVVCQNIRLWGGVRLPLVLSLSLSYSFSLTPPLLSPSMDPSIVNDGFHHQLIPQYRDQPAAYGISSSSSSTLLPDKFPPHPIDPASLAVFWHHHPALPLPPAQDNQMPVPFPYNIPPAYTHDIQEDSVPLGGREKRHW